MPSRRLNPRLVKRHRAYTAGELAERLNVHKNTVRHWHKEGLPAIDNARPILFQGETVRTFLANRNAGRKRPCPPGTFYCFTCREPRRPAAGMVEYSELRRGSGNLCALCEACGTVMYRRARRAGLATAMPGIDVQIRQAPSRLADGPDPSRNSDSEEAEST
jgi:hypothetical protein